MRSFIGVILLLSAAWPALADERKTVLIYEGYLSGEQCHRASNLERSSYMMGVVNGLLISPFHGAPAHRLKPLNRCLSGVTSTQLAATLQKWLKQNPERWNDGCHIAASMALRQLCGDF